MMPSPSPKERPFQSGRFSSVVVVPSKGFPDVAVFQDALSVSRISTVRFRIELE